jgi:hypothetical protein
MTLAFLTLLHLLIPIYWLGGDLGAFYSAGFMTDAKRSVPERMLALKILNNIDMAPRTALILAFPTGFTLAAAKAWISVPPLVVGLVWLVALFWLGLAWLVHLRHGTPNPWYKSVDMFIRYAALAGLLGVGAAIVLGAVDFPLFIGLKMIILGAAIAMGLVVRVLLKPLFPAIITLTTSGPTPESDQAIVDVIKLTRPAVLCLWALILIASYLGIATPL